ncbi:caspase-8-like [Polyodon spathula]|uniref:caspase-8-like n=1 Tax=Polyodon spathula TaxID=7913 RepID=UPI001B7F6661|nr:caspase-8-like [Polyodon spathula]XP_041120700.1 caspase-8-like [Polyodon spathula]
MDLSILHKIDEDLDSEEVAALKFLCLDHIPKKKQETIRDAKDLFIRLKEQGKLGDDDQDIVPELLYTIRRFDLLKVWGTSKQEVQNRLDTSGKIPAFRKMLYNISENLTTDEVKAIKFLLTEELRRSTLEDDATILDVFAEMEKMEILGEDELSRLQHVCSKTSKDIAQKIEDYKQKQAARTQTPYPFDMGRSAALVPPSSGAFVEHHNRQHPQHSQQFGDHTLDLPGQQSSQNSEVPPRLSLDAGPVSVTSVDNMIAVYKMTSKPRGYCVIINNKDFERARLKFPSRLLKDRKGTDIDAEYLSKVFKWLHFEVVQYNDQTAEEIRSTMESYRKRDHSSMDCFVCCILSHGLKGAIEGTDGGSVSIRDITSYFTGKRCPSLTKKPKVFFIQACQGQKIQIAVKIYSDGEGPVSQVENEPEPEADAGPVQMDTIPNDSDFLLGMATMEDYLSYRSISKGSFYIQALCRNLELLCPRNEDILSILTTVNREVSRENFMNSKQMPEPRYTLTKKLLFPTS